MVRRESKLVFYSLNEAAHSRQESVTVLGWQG